MKRVTPFLLLPFLAMACQDEGPTAPVDGLQPMSLADKPAKPPGLDEDKTKTEYEFVFPTSQDDLGSDCWYPEPGGDENLFARDFYCPIDLGWDPVLVFKVVDGDDGAVTAGSVTFRQCWDTELAVPARWVLCGVRQKPPNKKRFEARDYPINLTYFDLDTGLASVTFSRGDRVVLYDNAHNPAQDSELGWGGMRWVYNDGSRGDLGSDWFNIRPFPRGSN